MKGPRKVKTYSGLGHFYFNQRGNQIILVYTERENGLILLLYEFCFQGNLPMVSVLPTAQVSAVCQMASLCLAFPKLCSSQSAMKQ